VRATTVASPVVACMIGVANESAVTACEIDDRAARYACERA
jgi:hypothetical protein